jgi:hypothetical protein
MAAGEKAMSIGELETTRAGYLRARAARWSAEDAWNEAFARREEIDSSVRLSSRPVLRDGTIVTMADLDAAEAAFEAACEALACGSAAECDPGLPNQIKNLRC